MPASLSHRKRMLEHLQGQIMRNNAEKLAGKQSGRVVQQRPKARAERRLRDRADSIINRSVKNGEFVVQIRIDALHNLIIDAMKWAQTR